MPAPSTFHSFILFDILSVNNPGTFIQSLLKLNCPLQFHTFVYESIIERVLGNFRLRHKTHFILPLMSGKMEHCAMYHRRAWTMPNEGMPTLTIQLNHPAAIPCPADPRVRTEAATKRWCHLPVC